MPLTLHKFSAQEERLFAPFKSWCARVTQPLNVMLQRWRVKPDTLSYLGVGMAVFFVYFFAFNPALALVFLLLNIFFDILDGAYARFLKAESAKGFLLDIFCDYVSFFLIFLTFLFYHFVPSFWGAIFLLNYVVMAFFTLILDSLQVALPYIIKAKYTLYVFFGVWLVTGYNFMDAVIVFFALYMVVSNLYLFHKLRCSLS